MKKPASPRHRLLLVLSADNTNRVPSSTRLWGSAFRATGFGACCPRTTQATLCRRRATEVRQVASSGRAYVVRGQHEGCRFRGAPQEFDEPLQHARPVLSADNTNGIGRRQPPTGSADHHAKCRMCCPRTTMGPSLFQARIGDRVCLPFRSRWKGPGQ